VIQPQTRLKVADNTGARSIQCIRVMGRSLKTTAGVGDVIVASVKQALPNSGEDYRRRFREIYPTLAKANGAVLVPFLLEGVAGVPSLNQADGVHPTAEGHRRLAETVWKALRPLLS